MRIYFYVIAVLMVSGCASYSKEVQAHREEYKQEFLTDPRSPLKEEDLVHLDFFPALAKGKVKAEIMLTPGEEPFELPTYSGLTRTYRKWGIATFPWGDFKASLTLYENMTLKANPVYKDYLFLPFKDLTNGETTYGGGRYLNMSKADTEDGKIIIDFNTCYNPWCAYSDGFNCPIPPVENHLPFAVEAGEKVYAGEHKSVKNEK